MAPGDFDGPDLQRFLIDPKVDLAPDAPFGAAMLAGVPLAFTFDLDPGAVDQQVQRALRPTVGDVDGQGLLTTGQRAEVRHRPIEANKPQQALDEPGRLPERHAEQNLHRQAGLNSSVTVGLLTATPACRHGIPAHLGVEPDRQRAPALERFIVGWPVPGLVGRGCGSAHASQLPRWIHEMNPSRDLCNRADERTGLSFYRVEVILPEAEAARIAPVELLPGMPVDAFIRTRDRTPMAYFLEPISIYFERAFREG